MRFDFSRLTFWRRMLAGILDFITIFAIGGYLIGRATGGLTDNGFNLNGPPALALFALILAYFFVANRYLNGTLWKHVLAKPPAS